jgi:tetratricopeptide (TPR) repeat protein
MKMDMSVQSDANLQQVYEFLEAGEPGRAKPVIEDALTADLENPEIEFVLHCVNFWIDKIPAQKDLDDRIDYGEYLIRRWKQFLLFIRETYGGVKQDSGGERAVHALMKGVFSAALDCFLTSLGLHQVQHKGVVYRRIGLCYKKLGEYETALQYLVEANAITPDLAPVLAEMADCYALCGNDRNAKVLFREAFFLDPSKIDLCFLDSGMIRRLIELVEEKGFSGNSLLEWIPVYGFLYGIFSVKRELRALEAGKLKQSIYEHEIASKESGGDPAILVPRLINHYFWLIDHLMVLQKDRSKIEETLLKIKLLDEEVYKQYTGVL